MLLFAGAASHIRPMPIPFCVRIDGRGDHCVHDPRHLQRVGRSVGDQSPVLRLSGIEPDLMSLPEIRCRPISPPVREGNGAEDCAPVRRKMAGLDWDLALVRKSPGPRSSLRASYRGRIGAVELPFCSQIALAATLHLTTPSTTPR